MDVTKSARIEKGKHITLGRKQAGKRAHLGQLMIEGMVGAIIRTIAKQNN